VVCLSSSVSVLRACLTGRLGDRHREICQQLFPALSVRYEETTVGWGLGASTAPGQSVCCRRTRIGLRETPPRLLTLKIMERDLDLARKL
jgi:hypothetical protein